MKNAFEIIPEQHLGNHTDFSEKRSFKNADAAQDCFKKATERLLRVNEWHHYVGPGSAKFSLTNNLGKEIAGFAHEGLFFNIDLPAPGSNAGGGLEWVMIEQIQVMTNPTEKEEFITMTVRPVSDPRKMESTVAHFFSDVSTSTFVVKRTHLTVSAEVHGRNETPNNKDVDLHDKIRNTVIALGARVGLSGPQWKKLAKGLLDD